MDEAAPRGVHALSFASLAHKSFIKDVSFAYTGGEKHPPRTARKYRYKRLLCGLAGEGGGWVCAAFSAVFFLFFAVLIHYELPFKRAYHV